ncbi:MAG: transposase [Candidatus Competibacter sp.]
MFRGISEARRKYRIQNWRTYNAALVAGGLLTIWFDEEAVAGEYGTERAGRQGVPRRYADAAVQCGLVIREVFQLPLRALTGFLASLVELLELVLTILDFSTFSRWATGLTVLIGRRGSQLPRHGVIDSTSLKVYGEGGWNVR